MSLTTPPGWYPDPEGVPGEPARERWWDGSEWTAHVRPTAEALAKTPTLPSGPSGTDTGPGTPPPSRAPGHALPTLPSGVPAGPPPRRPRRRTALLFLCLGALGLALAAAVLVPLLLDGGGRDGGQRGGPRPGPSTEQGGPDGGNGADTGAELSEQRVDGVALPLLDGWSEREAAGGVLLVHGGYPCPADAELDCLEGGAQLRALPGAGTLSTEGVARADIPELQRDAYPPTAYGGVFGTEELAAEPVTVAGQPGYRVRVRLSTPLGHAQIESVAFVSPQDRDTLLLLRLTWDEVDSAPPLEDLAEILRGTTTVSTGSGTAAAWRARKVTPFACDD
ncbi:DUF2510 domain-containing protein [Streptomyces sp. NBRC 109706]|uniref:DUF2510 domain-containing protein n=1 Tax=Streptomyces sp. NBRC 109706 TaxID=1550035 RepID=UPI0007826536|nr:DUF2510 domain-containing protein [Streptomyces sp. NBRC 109706]